MVYRLLTMNKVV